MVFNMPHKRQNHSFITTTNSAAKLMKTRTRVQHTKLESRTWNQMKPRKETSQGMEHFCLSLAIILAITQAAVVGGTGHLKSDRLCSQCSACDTDKCPPSEAYPHMTAFDDTLIAGALQSDYVSSKDRGVYSVPNIKGGESTKNNSYFGWESASGSASGYHRFRNYMDKCSDETYLTVDKHGKVKLRPLKKLGNLGDADWKSINPPKQLNHRGFRFWVSRSTGKCLTVFGGKTEKRTVGVADCEFGGSNPFQLFAFRFHYHKAFCCCGKYND